MESTYTHQRYRQNDIKDSSLFPFLILQAPYGGMTDKWVTSSSGAKHLLFQELLIELSLGGSSIRRTQLSKSR